MHTELFGVFGGRDTFERLRSPELFDEIVAGDAVTVGVSDESLGRPCRSDVHQAADGLCVVFGELYPPSSAASDPAAWVYDHYQRAGESAFSDLNGSYLVVVEHDGEVVVVTDQLRSRECFYADEGTRVFGTDAVGVARTLRDRTVDYESFLEFLYLSVVLGSDTLYEEIDRIPFDGVLRRDSVEQLDRFVYRPESFDYAAALGDRLERAIRRRNNATGPNGLLLSAGYDSRAVLPTADVDVCYTVGEPGSQEVERAEQLAERYGARHETLPPDARYLNTDPEMCRYTHGIRESLHIHHSGYETEMGARRMFHGWAFDSLLREHFVPQQTVEVLDKVLPLNRLETDPDPVEFALRKFGYLPEAADVHDRLRAKGLVDFEPEPFVDATLRREFDSCRRPGESDHNVANRFGVKNLPSAPFRAHLADNFEESFIAADLELLSWHLRTPPEHRNTQTYLKALDHVDDSLLDIRPPDRPHNNFVLNQAEKFVRRKFPMLQPFGTPWPSRREVYERNDLDDILFPDQPWIHHHSPRFKLRLHDALCWLGSVEQRTPVTPDVLLGQRTFTIGE